MRCFVKRITKRTRSGVIHDDRTLDADMLTIGRATDRHIQLAGLRVAFEHAHIGLTEGRPVIRAEPPSEIRVNRKPVGAARLRVGDEIMIGNNRLEVLDPPDGCEFAVQVEALAGGRGTENMLARNSRFGLGATGLSMRLWSWTLFVIVLCVFLILPIGASLQPGMMEKLRDMPAVSDQTWLTGQLAGVHRFIGNDCNACHVKPFVMVQNQACAECHGKTPHHVDPGVYDMAAHRETRCGACHHEHVEPANLIRSDSRLCAECHENLGERVPGTELLDAGDFELNHPEFRVTLASPAAGAATRVSLQDAANLFERSGLTFSHADHLKPGGLRTHEGRIILGCADCHRAEPGGAGMEPIRFESTCAECHKLSFDRADPEREVIHGDADRVRLMIRDYYAARALEGGYLDEAAPDIVRRRRLPGRALTTEQRKEALDWARSTAQRVAARIFESTTCASCHQVTRLKGDPPRWDVLPVHVISTWMPYARFDHSRHTTMACTSCHDITKSELAGDVALPGVDSCRECHGRDRSRDKLQSTCVDCHRFHLPRHADMSGSASK